MTSKEREKKLHSIPVNEASLHHEWLRECFSQELERRLDDSSDIYEEFENIYQCALLLWHVGDLSDLPLMYSAKFSGDMDLGVGFDAQFIFMADPETLKDYARSIERPDIVEFVDEFKAWCLDEEGPIEAWMEYKLEYFRN